MDDIIQSARSVLSTTPERWLLMTEALAADLLQRQPAAGEWSALECLQHLIDTEHIFPFRVRCLLAGEDFPAFDPDQQGTKAPSDQSPGDIAREFAHMRAESLALLAGVTEADLDRRARHQALGQVTMGEMLHEWAGHDLMHTVQGERALMQPFIDGCGPWQSYFTDHWVRQG